MDKYCIIDIGTNSIRMLTAKLENGYIIDNNKVLEMTRIGEGVNRTNMLSTEAINRSIMALKKFKEQASIEGIENIKAIATSAVRDAINKNVFLERAEKELALDIEVISGEREAELGFLGVIKGIDKKLDNVLAIDIGGGSTEFILGTSDGVKYLRSLNVGAVRMTDKHITTDPISDSELNTLTEDIKKIISEVIEKIKKFEIEEVVGIGGTATSLAAIAQGLETYDTDRVHNYELKIEKISEMLDRFKNSNNDERKKIKGLQAKRGDIILAGSKILYEILTSLNTKKIRISEYDNLEGYIYWDIENRNRNID